MINEVKRFLDTNLYRSFVILHSQYAQFFKNFSNAYKLSIGVEIDKLLCKCIKNMSDSYILSNEKQKYANESYNILRELEIKFKLLYESYKCISESQYTSLMKECGKIESQLVKWISYLNIG